MSLPQDRERRINDLVIDALQTDLYVAHMRNAHLEQTNVSLRELLQIAVDKIATT